MAKIYRLRIEIIRNLVSIVQNYELTEDYLIGRDRTCDIRLDNSAISRKHATLVRMQADDGEFYCITDGFRMQLSTQGILVNGDRVLSRKLRSGDVITFVESAKLDISIKAYYEIEGDKSTDDEFKTVPYFRSG